MHRVTVNLTDDEYARLRELCPDGVSESAFFRRVFEGAGPLDEPPSHEESLRLLAESARGGKVAARIALERALRPVSGPAAAEGELARLLRDE